MVWASLESLGPIVIHLSRFALCFLNGHLRLLVAHLVAIREAMGVLRRQMGRLILEVALGSPNSLSLAILGVIPEKHRVDEPSARKKP